MVASTDIKWFTSSNLNAPQLSNAWGVMIDVLDACLITGINIGTVSTLTASGTAVTATFGTAHGVSQYQVIQIFGASPTEYNGEFTVTTVPNTTSLTFELAATPSASTATGTITAKLAPAGWEKTFSGTQKAAYRSLNTLLPSRPYLRVDNAKDAVWTDAYAKYAKVGIVETMTDIDTMSGVQAPYDAALPDKNWVGTGSGTSAIAGWAKWVYATSLNSTNSQQLSASATAGNRKWYIVGTTDCFYLFTELTANEGNYVVYGFGAFESIINTDNSSAFLSCFGSYAPANNGIPTSKYNGLTYSSAQNDPLMVLRKYDQSTVPAYLMVSNVQIGSSAATSTGQLNIVAAPSASIPIYSSDMIFFENASSVPRGKVPLLRWLSQLKPYTHGQIINESSQLFMAINVSPAGLSGQILIKVGDL